MGADRHVEVVAAAGVGARGAGEPEVGTAQGEQPRRPGGSPEVASCTVPEIVASRVARALGNPGSARSNAVLSPAVTSMGSASSGAAASGPNRASCSRTDRTRGRGADQPTPRRCGSSRPARGRPWSACASRRRDPGVGDRLTRVGVGDAAGEAPSAGSSTTSAVAVRPDRRTPRSARRRRGRSVNTRGIETQTK